VQDLGSVRDDHVRKWEGQWKNEGERE
jgi:hypothetical protein